MHHIKKCFTEYDSTFMMRLKDIDIDVESKNKFMSETALAVIFAIKNTSLEKAITMLLSDNPAQLLYLIDTDKMAEKLNISREQVDTGLAAIAPVMTQIFLLNCNEIVAATASSGWSAENENISLVK